MNFEQFLLILWVRRWVILAVTGFLVTVTLIVSLLLPKTYVATAALVLDVKGADPVTGLVLPAQLLPGYMATQVEIIKSHNVALKVVDALNLANRESVREDFLRETDGRGTVRDWLAGKLIKFLEVEPSRASSLVRVSYRGNDPEFAALLANAFADAYITTNLELRTEPAKQSASFFNAQLKQLAENLEQARAKLSAYQRDKGIVAVEEPLDVESRRLADLSTQLVAAQAQTHDVQARLRQLDAALKAGSSADTVSDVLLNPLVQSLKNDLARNEAKLAELSQRVGANHPDHRRLTAEVAEIRAKIAAEMRTVSATLSNQVRAAQQREAEARAALAAQKSRVLDITKQRDELAVLLREVQSAQLAYDTAAQRFGQTRLESQTTQTNVAVLNRAIPPMDASSPKMQLNLVLALVFGLMLGVAAALVWELRDRRVRSEGDLSDALGVPVIGDLSKARERRGLEWARPARWLKRGATA